MWKQKIRGWHIAAGLHAIAIAGSAIAIYLNRGGRLDAVAMTSYFPDREATVVHIDVASIRSSGLLDRIVGSTVGEEAEYKAFVQQTGFDYKRDLDRVMVNSAGGVHYFLLQGRFDWDRLKAYAAKQGGSCRGDECWLKGSTPDRVISFRPINKTMMALASARDESGSKAIERRSAYTPPYSVPAQPLWIYVPPQAVRTFAQMPRGMRPFARALEPAEHVMFSLGPAQDRFDLTMEVACRTPQEAAELRAQLEGLTKLLQSFITRENQKPNPQDLSGVLTSGTFTRADKNVVGKWAIQRAFFESLGGS